MDKSLTLLEAVKIARGFHESSGIRYFQQRLICPDRIVIADDLTQSVSNSVLICTYADPIPFLVGELKKRGITVRILAVNVTVNVLGLASLKGGNILEIRVRQNASFCVKRFAILKELIHYFKPEWYANDTSEKALYDSISQSSRCRSVWPGIVTPLHIESFCYYCAIETLLWWGKDGAARGSLADMHQSGVTEYVMACAFRVPLSVVQYFFEADSRYAGVSNQLNLSI